MQTETTQILIAASGAPVARPLHPVLKNRLSTARALLAAAGELPPLPSREDVDRVLRDLNHAQTLLARYRRDLHLFQA